MTQYLSMTGALGRGSKLEVKKLEILSSKLNLMNSERCRIIPIQETVSSDLTSPKRVNIEE